jgi:hypothetical protein
MTAFGARQRCPDNTSENLKVYNNVTLLMPTWVSFKVADDYLPFFLFFFGRVSGKFSCLHIVLVQGADSMVRTNTRTTGIQKSRFRLMRG